MFQKDEHKRNGSRIVPLCAALAFIFILSCAATTVAQAQDPEIAAGSGGLTVNDEPTITIGASGTPVVNIGSAVMAESA